MKVLIQKADNNVGACCDVWYIFLSGSTAVVQNLDNLLAEAHDEMMHLSICHLLYAYGWPMISHQQFAQGYTLYSQLKKAEDNQKHPLHSRMPKCIRCNVTN